MGSTDQGPLHWPHFCHSGREVGRRAAVCRWCGFLCKWQTRAQCDSFSGKRGIQRCRGCIALTINAGNVLEESICQHANCIVVCAGKGTFLFLYFFSVTKKMRIGNWEATLNRQWWTSDASLVFQKEKGLLSNPFEACENLGCGGRDWYSCRCEWPFCDEGVTPQFNIIFTMSPPCISWCRGGRGQGGLSWKDCEQRFSVRLAWLSVNVLIRSNDALILATFAN